MNPESRRSLIALSLVCAVVVSLCLVLLLPAEEPVSAEDLHCRLDSLGEDPAGPADMRERARQLGALFYGDSDECREFAAELTELHLACCDVDFLLVYNTGGFGGGTMADDPEWPGVLEGIREELAALGYSSLVVEHRRGSGGLMGFLDELDELGCDYCDKAPVLAAKLAFLTRYNPSLRVITTGRCFGAMISNEVMELEAGNPQVYSIQAGWPFWYTGSCGERTLLIEGNGLRPDILDSRGVLRFLWALGEANACCLPSSSPPEEGSFRALNWYLKAPGHTYTWGHPGVQSRVTAFLREQFG